MEAEVKLMSIWNHTNFVENQQFRSFKFFKYFLLFQDLQHSFDAMVFMWWTNTCVTPLPLKIPGTLCIPCKVVIEAVSIYTCNILINQVITIYKSDYDYTGTSGMRGTYLEQLWWILRNAVHDLPQEKERQLTENWYDVRISNTTKGSKLITSIIFPIPTEILLKCIINFIRKIFLPVFGNSSAYGEIEKLNYQKEFISYLKLCEFDLKFTDWGLLAVRLLELPCQ